MQPYWFPYLGYFQLIGAVEAFVIYDDVNYITGGWINRNYILSRSDRLLITLRLKGASQNKLINQITIDARREKIIKTIQQNYGKAPEYKAVFPMIEEILMRREDNLSRSLEYGLKQICAYLGLSPVWHVSSDIKKDNELRGQEKVLAICESLGATHYVNAIGGKDLYSREVFADKGLDLSFIRPKPIAYPQFRVPFVANLSVIDAMMFNDQAQCRKLLGDYELV